MCRLAILLVVLLGATAEKTAEKVAPSKRSTLAPIISYVDIWAELHSTDAALPKVMLLLDGEDSTSEAPSWFSTVAMNFKSGRKKTAAFLVVAPGKDAKRAATRFGLAEIPAGGALFACSAKEGFALQFDGDSLASGSSSEKRQAVQAFVERLVSSGIGEDEEGRMALPGFPEPTRPRKKAEVTLDEFTHETLPINCYGVKAKPLCVFAVLPDRPGSGCPAAVTELAKHHAIDPISFGCVGAKGQSAFLSAYGLASSGLPALLAIKAGKRPRFVKHEGAFEASAMRSFVDNIIGGGATFKRLSDLPELEPPYLIDDDGEKDEV